MLNTNTFRINVRITSNSAPAISNSTLPTISGDNQRRVFTIGDGSELRLCNVTISGGWCGSEGSCDGGF